MFDKQTFDSGNNLIRKNTINTKIHRQSNQKRYQSNSANFDVETLKIHNTILVSTKQFHRQTNTRARTKIRFIHRTRNTFLLIFIAFKNRNIFR